MKEEPAAPEVALSADLEQFAARAYEYITPNYAYKTLEAYRPSIEAFIRIIGNKSLSDITPSDVDRFKLTRMTELSPRFRQHPIADITSSLQPGCPLGHDSSQSLQRRDACPYS